jgi:hypothetical protein
LRSDFSSAFLIFLLHADYCGGGVPLGDGAGDSSVAFFLAVFFGEADADGDPSVEADVEVFFAVVFLAEVDVAWVVVPVDAVVSSFFWD